MYTPFCGFPAIPSSKPSTFKIDFVFYAQNFACKSECGVFDSALRQSHLKMCALVPLLGNVLDITCIIWYESYE